MFDLDKEIDAWCRSVRSNRWKQASSHAELKDHLHCEVERLSKEGVSEQQAFLAATERMGNVEDLRMENAKNRSLLSTFSGFLLAHHAKEPLLPTITSAIGMLLGGLLGATIGIYSARESVVMVGYVLGFLGGAVAGAVIGWRWHSRRNPDGVHGKDSDVKSV